MYTRIKKNLGLELEYLFFCRAKRNFFFQNLTLCYMTKTPPKSEYFFRKKPYPLPFQVKWSFPYDVFFGVFFTCFWVNLWTAHFYQFGALLLRKGVKCHSPIL